MLKLCAIGPLGVWDSQIAFFGSRGAFLLVIRPGVLARLSLSSWHIDRCTRQRLRQASQAPRLVRHPRTATRRFRTPEPWKSIPTIPSFDGATIALYQLISQTIAHPRSAYHISLAPPSSRLPRCRSRSVASVLMPETAAPGLAPNHPSRLLGRHHAMITFLSRHRARSRFPAHRAMWYTPGLGPLPMVVRAPSQVIADIASEARPG